MNLTLTVKLDPDPEQRRALLETLEAFNNACNYIAEVAFQQHCANKYTLQKLIYREVRERFGLSAQMAIRAISKVVEVYKRDKRIQPTFRLHGSMVYDQRIYSFKGVDRVSLLTLSGRVIVPILFGLYQAARMDLKRGQCDLIYRDGVFYLSVSVDAPEPTPIKPIEFIGIDMGIVNIVADSDGQTYSGSKVNSIRKRYTKLRAKLQAKQTKSAKRLLKMRRRKEQRFAKDTNHVIAKKLVAKALDSGRGIALEDLKGIRERMTVRRAQRRTHHSWSFYDLRAKIEYKAKLAGVPVVLVDPRNTSRTCIVCGSIDKRNRPNQATFLCTSCGFAGLADVIAARVISSRGAVMRPHAATLTG